MNRVFVTFFLIAHLSIFTYSSTELVEWKTLSEYEFETGTMNDKIKSLINNSIEIAGFIVPLEMDEYIDKVSEFFLVPDPLACIHVPPPPPNQMIYVRMNKPIPVNMDFRGVLIRGKLTLAKSTIQNQMVGFELAGVFAKEANIDYELPFDFLFQEEVIE